MTKKHYFIHIGLTYQIHGLDHEIKTTSESKIK